LTDTQAEIVEVGPFVLYTAGDPRVQRGDDSALYLQVNHDDDGWFVLLPQFDMEIEADEPATMWDILLRRLLGFYATLSDLDAEFVTDVQRWQMKVIESRLLPWLGREYGAHPEYITPPPVPEGLDERPAVAV
jgi:hypothetical protein